MTMRQLYYKLFCVMQWTIGISRGNIEQIIKEKKFSLKFTWLPLNNSTTSIADPFLFRSKKGNLIVLYEDFSMIDLNKYGKLEMVTLREDFTPIAYKKILDSKSHISYPFIFDDNGTTYIIPESKQSGRVKCYEFDYETESLVNERILIDKLPLIDSTFIKYQNKYWLFATLGDNLYDHSKLYIYFADNFLGPYKPHPQNPGKYNIRSSRPAGKFIIVDDEIYRPSQNCEKHYGHSITINKIVKLDEYQFMEEYYMDIVAEKKSLFNEGIHTINVLDDIIVIDGIKMVFNPLIKFMLFFQKRRRTKSKKSFLSIV